MTLGSSSQQRRGNSLAHHIPDNYIKTLIRVFEKNVEVAVDCCEGTVSAATLSPGISLGGSSSSKVCWILKPISTSRSWACASSAAAACSRTISASLEIVSGLKFGGSSHNPLLQLGVERADPLLGPFAVLRPRFARPRRQRPGRRPVRSAVSLPRRRRHRLRRRKSSGLHRESNEQSGECECWRHSRVSGPRRARGSIMGSDAMSLATTVWPSGCRSLWAHGRARYRPR